MLPTSSAIMLGGARPVAIGPRACDGAAQVASTCGDLHLAGSRPHARGRLCFGCSHGRRSICAAAVRRHDTLRS